MVALLKALASGDTTSAKSDLTKLKTDLAAEEATLAETASTSSSDNLTKDVTSLLKDLTSGDTKAAKSDITNVQSDLKAEDSSSTSSKSPLETLIDKMATSLSSGSTTDALQDLASYLVHIGQGTGSLVDTTA
jgi:hypothetical protein